jgi:thermitase
VSRSAAFGAIICVALVTAFAARVPSAKAWETTSRTSAAATRISHAKLRVTHTSWTGAKLRARVHQSQLRILPLLRHVGARPAKKVSRARGQTPPQPTAVAAPPAPLTVLPNDPEWSQQWSLRQVEAPAAWALGPGASRPVVVAVVDSGVDPAQPDLQGALVAGADFADSTGSTADQYGHGTMVAGVIAARGNNNQGVAGVCWVCRIMPIKVLDANGVGTAASVADGIRWAADHGANVINLSFVLSGPDPTVEAAIAYAHGQGAIVVAAAGNAGSTDATYPAAYPMVVSVAATDDSDHLYPWSSYGSWVTLAAPGCSMTTALGGGFATFCGTSAAAPMVAGLAALGYAAGASSEAELEAALERTAKPLPGSVGSGRVDALQLLHQFVQN